MVNIVTGKINSGKTTRMLAHYLKNQAGDGFLCLKTMNRGNVEKYDAYWLSKDLEKPLILHESISSKDDRFRTKVGPYCFIDETMIWIESAIQKMIDEGVSPIYLDEIGLLELQDDGFAEILRKMLDSSLDIIISVRSELVSSVIDHFQMKDVTIMSNQ